MIGGVVFVALAVFFDWLFWVTPEPGLAGFFLAGSTLSVLAAGAWFADAWRLRR